MDTVIADDTPYDILLGLPWIRHVNGNLYLREGEFVAEVYDPQNYHHKLEVPVSVHHSSLPCHAHSAPVNLFLSVPSLKVGLGEFSSRIIQSTPAFTNPVFVTRKYKPVARKVRPVPATIPKKQRSLEG